MVKRFSILGIVSSLTLLATASLFTGCEKSEDKIKQLTDTQSQIQSANQVTAEKQYLEQKAKLMEDDLIKRQRFYQAVAGTYEGTVVVNNANFSIRMTIVPSLPRYVPDGRVRTPEEVAAELSNLYLNVQVVQWNPQDTRGSYGCLVQQVRPDIVRGRIDVVSSSCLNLYSIRPGREGASVSSVREAAAFALDLVDGRVESVSQINGKIQPTSNANVYTFTATRVQE
jgi:hypothetical protein